MEDVNKKHNALCAELLEKACPSVRDVLGLYEEAHAFMMDDEAAYNRAYDGSVLDSGEMRFGALGFRPYIEYGGGNSKYEVGYADYERVEPADPHSLVFVVTAEDCAETSRLVEDGGQRVFEGYVAVFGNVELLRMDFITFPTRIPATSVVGGASDAHDATTIWPAAKKEMGSLVR